MKVAIIFPSHVSIVEKTAALFGDIDVLIVPLAPDDPVQGKLNANRTRLLKEGPGLGFSTRWIPLLEANLRDYDVLIDTWETRRWAPTWHKMAHEIDLPTILKISWFTPQTLSITEQDWDLFKRAAVLTDSLAAAKYWEAAGISATFVPWYPGDWWFDQEWSGVDARALFVLAGAYAWRGGPDKQPRLRDWLTMTQEWRVPGYHLDAADCYRTQLGLAKEMATFRCFVQLDCAASSRHLSLAFTEALAAGVPCLAVSRPEHDYGHNIVDGVTGFVCRDLNELAHRAQFLMDDHALAQRLSIGTKDFAIERFGRNAVMAEWKRAIERAQYLYLKAAK